MAIFLERVFCSLLAIYPDVTDRQFAVCDWWPRPRSTMYSGPQQKYNGWHSNGIREIVCRPLTTDGKVKKDKLVLVWR